MHKKNSILCYGKFQMDLPSLLIFWNYSCDLPKDFVMNQSIEQSVTKSSQVYLELDMDEPSMMMDMQKMMFMPEGNSNH
jgi:hypothetical protein